MSDTVRINGYLFRHHSANTKKRITKSFRLAEKLYVKKFGDFLVRCRTLARSGTLSRPRE